MDANCCHGHQNDSRGDLLERALWHQKKGNLEHAESLCQSVLTCEPRNANAMHLLGVLYHQTGRAKQALALITQAIRQCPSNPYYYNSLGSAFRNCGEIVKARRCFQRALQLQPGYGVAFYNLAGIDYAQENFDEALTNYRKAVSLTPAFPEALNNMAATFNKVGRYTEAIDCCDEAIRIRPDYGEAYNNIGNAYKGLGKPASAIKCYERAIALCGENVELLCNLANALQEVGRIDQAIATYRRALMLNPACGRAYNNLGTAYRAKRNTAEAKRQFQQAIKLAPQDVQGYHNLGNVFYDLGDFGAAGIWYERAISIRPDSVPTYINLGIIYQESGQSSKALQCFNKALTLDPHNSKAHSHLIHELYQRSDWRQIDALNAKVDRLTEVELANGQRPNEMPFLSIIRTADPQKNYRVAYGWSQVIAKTIRSHTNQLVHAKSQHRKKLLTIGYLSNNFRNHPTAHLVRNIFEYHDRTCFAVHAYSYGEDDGSRYRQDINQHADKFVDLCHSSHEDAARIIYRHGVDILIDLVGYMRGNRLEICAFRPAPIQVRWLGLAGTTGADFFDYIIADRTVIPENHAIHYSEKPVYLPDCYQINSQPLSVSDKKFTRDELGLPRNSVIYCCFCSNYKFEPVMFGAWMEILSSVPGSVLWLLKSNAIVADNLKKEAVKHGVDPRRLIFASKIDKANHLSRIECADIALDTRIVNGAATTSDALFAGVPVITLEGEHFASKMSASINRAIGLGDLVTRSLTDYIAMAVSLGKNRRQIEMTKKRLQRNIKVAPLFNPSLFVRNVEAAYLKMWSRYQRGEQPALIHQN